MRFGPSRGQFHTVDRHVQWRLAQRHLRHILHCLHIFTIFRVYQSNSNHSSMVRRHQRNSCFSEIKTERTVFSNKRLDYIFSVILRVTWRENFMIDWDIYNWFVFSRQRPFLNYLTSLFGNWERYLCTLNILFWLASENFILAYASRKLRRHSIRHQRFKALN